MSDEAKQFHEEDSMSKAYDWAVARRLFRYLKPYKGLVAIALRHFGGSRLRHGRLQRGAVSR